MQSFIALPAIPSVVLVHSIISNQECEIINSIYEGGMQVLK